MQAPVMPESPFAPAIGGKLLARVCWLSTFLLAAAFLCALVAVGAGSDTSLPEAWLLLLATVSTLAALARQLPAQNVLLAALITAFIGGVAHIFGAKAGIPFGQFMFGSEAGLKLFGTLPWIMPLLWVVAVLNSRGVARLVLRPWRKVRAYGFWLMGLTAMFTMLFDCALEPFAARMKHYWIWTADGFSLTPQGAPVSSSVGWFIVTLLILAFATPALINKQLSKRSSPDFHPLAVWLGAIFLFGVAAALHGVWLVVATDAVICVVTAVFAIRSAKW
ncbi:MAG: carotenoid biosynthesis protein [Verrucomicrobiales bacterium]|nr:carotenoid biosynthesis protein [Verrucomicrobiales bacterium]